MKADSADFGDLITTTGLLENWRENIWECPGMSWIWASQQTNIGIEVAIYGDKTSAQYERTAKHNTNAQYPYKYHILPLLMGLDHPHVKHPTPIPPAFTRDAEMHRGESNGATAAFTAATVDFARAPIITGRRAACIFDNIVWGWRGAMSTVDGAAWSLATSGPSEAPFTGRNL